MTATVGRIVVLTLTNQRGSSVAYGDVVVIDTAHDDSFTVDTSGAFTGIIGVCIEPNGIANGAAGRIQTEGYCAQVNLSGSTTRGHYIKTHTVAAQAADAGTSRVVGAFAQTTKTGSTPPAVLFGFPDASTGAGGAPSSAQYIVGALDGTLSSEKVRADLYKNYHPDNYPTSGLALSDEFDDSSLDVAWSWDSAPSGTVSESTYPGFLYLTGGTDSSATQRLLRRAFAPGGSTAFSVAAKVAIAMENGNYSNGIGIRLLDSSDTNIWEVKVIADGTATASDGYRILSTASTWITAATVPMITAPQYLLITRDASNVYKGYVSVNGIVWQYLGTTTASTTVAKVAIVYGVDTDALDDDASVDFVRVFNTETKKIGA